MDMSNRVIPERTRGALRLGPVAADFGVELRQFLRILGDRRRIIMAAVSVVTLFVLLVAFQLPPRYTATTQVLIDPKQTRVLDVQAIISGLSPEATEVESQVHVVRSEALVGRLVDRLNLTEDAEFNDALRGASFLPAIGRALAGLIPDGWRGGATGEAAFVTSEEEAQRRRNDVVQNVLERLKVRRNETSLVIDISLTSASPTKAAKMANALADLYILDQLETKFEQTRRATSWLNERLGLLRADLRLSEEAVEAFKAEHNLLGSAQGLTLDNQQLAELHKNLILARTAREEAEVRLQQIREISGSGGGLNRVANVVTSDLLTQLRQEQVRLIGERSTLASRYQPRHPKMVEVQSELDNLALKMRDEVRRIIMELENNVAVAKARERALEGSLGQQSVKSAGQNQLEIQLRQLELEAESNKQIYEAFLQRFKSLTDQDSIQQSDARVISQATVPRYPSFPNKKMIVAGGLAFGLMLGVFLALLVERLDHGVKTAAQLEALTGHRTVAVVPMVGGTAGPLAHDYVLQKPLSAYSEAIRALQNAILLSTGREPARSVVITSSLPDEGKSTVSLSLARLAARSGKRTVLVDCDLRRPSVSQLLPELNWQATIIDVLAGEKPLEAALVTDPASGLHVLGAREGGDRSPELVNSDAMRTLMKALQTRYDFVVIDSPPILPVGDTLVLSRLAETVVYVARWENTPRDAITTGLQALADAGASLVGTVLSQVDFERYTRFSYGDAGSHYRRYQGYYVE